MTKKVKILTDRRFSKTEYSETFTLGTLKMMKENQVFCVATPTDLRYFKLYKIKKHDEDTKCQIQLR